MTFQYHTEYITYSLLHVLLQIDCSQYISDGIIPIGKHTLSFKMSFIS